MSTAPTVDHTSAPSPQSLLIELARLLAREAARSDFASRCKTRVEGQPHA